MLKWIAVLILLIVLCFARVVFAEDIPENLINAIIQVESGGNPNAVSHCGAIGLMQITPIVLKEFNIINGKMCLYDCYGKPNTNVYIVRYLRTSDLYRPDINEKVGLWYLYRLKDHYLKNVQVFDNPFNFKGICINDNIHKTWQFFHNDYIKCASDYKIALILACYNGGYGKLRSVDFNVAKMPRETRQYVKRVLKIYNENKHKKVDSL